jgi:hypothetical protein
MAEPPATETNIAYSVMNTNNDTLECTVCGGTMRPISNVQNKFRKSKRYRCTCGHFKDVEEAFSAYLNNAASGLPEGIQEFEEESAWHSSG